MRGTSRLVTTPGALVLTAAPLAAQAPPAAFETPKEPGAEAF